MRAKAAQPDNRVHFWCPGCDTVHGITTSGKVVWGFNGDYDLPTITPSILVKSTHGNGKKYDDPEFVMTEKVCHSFVTDGRIQFLNDCTHDLAGQTVDLPEWPFDR